MTPEERGIEVNYDIKIESQQEVLQLAQHRFEELYSISLGSTSDDAIVYWTDHRCNDMTNVEWRDMCKKGLTWSCKEMYVAVSEWTPDTTCGTVLVHEFGHCMHGVAFGELDIDHSSTGFWKNVTDIYVETCDKGL